MPSDVDQEYAARQQQNSNIADGKALLAAHPELLAEVRGSGQLPNPPTPQQTTNPNIEARKAEDVRLGEQAHQIGEQAQSTIDTLEPVAKAVGGVAKGLNIVGGATALLMRGVPPAQAIAGGALLDQAEQKGTDWVLQQAHKLYGNNHPIYDTLVSLVTNGAIAGGMTGAVPDTSTPAVTGDLGEPPANPSGTILDSSGKPMPPSTAGGVTGDSAAPTPPEAAGASPATDVSRETSPAVEAATTLAQKQLDALKTAKVGPGIAEEFGKPEIGTTISNEETMANATALRQSVEGIFGKPVEAPTLSAETAALSGVFKDEAKDIVDTASQLGGRMAAGEAIDPTEMAAFDNKFSAYAIQYAKLAGARSEMGRGLQILDPLKPDNLQSTAVARLAQEWAAPNMMGKNIALAMNLSPERLAQTARQAGEDFSLGRSMYDAFNEYWVNNLLSNAARTSTRIGTSNATSAILTLPSRQIASFLPGSPIKMGEPLAGAQGFFDGFWHSLDIGLESAKRLQPLSQMEGGSIDPETWTPKEAISSEAFGLQGTATGTALDFAGSVLRLGNRAIMGVHQFGHAASKSMAGHMLAWRDAVDQASEEGLSGMEGYSRATEIYHTTLNDMPASMRLAASKEGDVMTFVNQLEKGSLPSLAQQMTEYPVIHQLMPFFRIGYNVTKAGADITPGIGQLTNLPDLIAGSPTQQYIAMGKMALGAIMGAAITHEFHQGNLAVDEYGKPYAKVGDYKIDFPPPLDFPIAAIGNFIANNEKMDDPTAMNYLGNYVKALGTATADNTIVQGLVNLKRLWVDVASGDSAALAKYAGETLTPIIPFSSLMGAVARGIDTSKRDPQTIGQELQSNIPGARERIQAKVDIFNKPSPAPTLGLPDAIIFPVNIGDVETDPVKMMIKETDAKFAHTPNVIFGRKQRPGESPDHPDIGVPLDNGNFYGPEHDEWNKARAQGLYDELEEYLRGDYKHDSPELRKQTVEHIGHTHFTDANWAMLDNPKISKLYDDRMARKGMVNTPSDNPSATSASGAAPAVE